MKILCIEDDSETAKLIAEELTDRAFDVIIARDGQEGLIAILKGIPDLVLCDIGLPKMSGFDVLARLNELTSRMKPVPFLFLTALTDRENKLRAESLGADDYISKPIDFDRLETIIWHRLATTAHDSGLKRPILNDGEAEALTWVACGKTPAEVAKMLGLAEHNVDNQLNSACTKLGCHDVVCVE